MNSNSGLQIRYSPNDSKRTPESYVLHACLDFLQAEHIWAVRMNTGSLALQNKKGGFRQVAFGVKGMADILAMPTMQVGNLGHIVPVPLWIECKQEGKKLSKFQHSFRDWVTDNGHFYLVAYKPEDIAEWIKTHRRMQ